MCRFINPTCKSGGKTSCFTLNNIFTNGTSYIMQLPQIFHTGGRLHNTRLNHKGNRGLGGDEGMRLQGLEKTLLPPPHPGRWQGLCSLTLTGLKCPSAAEGWMTLGTFITTLVSVCTSVNCRQKALCQKIVEKIKRECYL